ncbi:MAG: hypothetical protein KJP05_01045, partial [Deltaproteobacteria bacterium]|nr:hypothetical protein [Deltaproteobacteria bacterium]
MMSNLYFCKYFSEGVDEQNFLLADARPHWTPSRDMILSHIYLDLEVDVEGKKLEGTGHINFSSVKKNLESIFLDARELRIERVTT